MAEKDKKAGRPAHVPTDEQRRQVEVLSGYGVPERDIAALVGISDVTLRKYYRSDLDIGMAKANAKVAQSLFQKATGDGPQSATCAIFWMKTRAGWKETTINEVVGKDGGPIRTEDVSARDRINSRIAGIAARKGADSDTGEPK